MVFIRCSRCGYEWEYSGKLKFATCPNCLYKVKVGKGNFSEEDIIYDGEDYGLKTQEVSINVGSFDELLKLFQGFDSSKQTLKRYCKEKGVKVNKIV